MLDEGRKAQSVYADSRASGGVVAQTVGPASADDSKLAERTERTVLPPVVVYHDIFNLVAIFFLNIFNFYYLATGTAFQLFYLGTMLYFVVDLIWVAAVPRSVKSPLVILLHHLITALYILIPYHYPQYEWCMSYCMLVEVNTWLLIAKRTLRWSVLEVLFYATWVGLRNIWYPYLIWEFYKEWKVETAACGSPWNPILITPIFQAALTGLNYYWTVSLLMKPKKQKQL